MVDWTKYKQESRISVAPMMDWTDRHCRYFHRLIAPSVKLYTEMVTTGALLHGERDRFLRFNDAEKPLALQLGGSDPKALADCTKMAEDYGYDEVNLNCGCPSDRVQNGRFGACLMQEPDHVATCVEAMQSATSLPVTIKCRIGVDDQEEESFIHDFVRITSQAGCHGYIIHARKAYLKGLSPKENRDVPPLRYDVAASVKEAFPDYIIALNGGLKSVEDVASALKKFDGAMIGREAYQNPFILADYETQFLNQAHHVTRHDVIEQMVDYIERQMMEGVPLKSITRHMIGLFQGLKGAKRWRRELSTKAFLEDSKPSLLLDASRHFSAFELAAEESALG